MKTIFRYTNIGLLMAVIIALGAVAGFAQDNCADADGQTKLGDEIRALFPLKDMPSRKSTIEKGKQFLEKYGACESAKDLSEYLKGAIPKLEATYTQLDTAAKEKALIDRFNAGLNAKNWDEVYSAGNEILTKHPDKFRDVELALGSIGYDESFKNNFKYNEQTLRYAKMAIADLESGKTFSASYGVPKDFVYKSKDNALGWMNLTIGYILQKAQKNLKDAQPHLFKATQLNSDTNKNPIPYEMIGDYYFVELNKITEDIQKMAADQKPDDTEEVAKAKVAAIKAKVALSNGTSERAMDAFARAYTLASSTVAAKPYKDKMKKNVADAYKLRFNKTEGVDAWIASAVAKPLVNPTTPVTPISDPEPVAPVTTTTSTTPTSTTPPATTKPGAATPPAKPAAAPATKPAPGKTGAKPQAKSAKKPVAKRRAV
jgi:hypothetical protein